MKKSEQTRSMLIAQCGKYPQMRPQDIFKFLYQSSFGCEHLVSSVDGAIDYIRREYGNNIEKREASVEPLDGGYSRIDLSYLGRGLSAETLGRLFCASARKETAGMEALTAKLEVARELAYEERFFFSAEEFEKALDKWRDQGYPPVHHSDGYRELYRPSYRVIANKYIPFLPLFARLDGLTKEGRATVAIEGGSASGKSTLGQILSEIYDCTLFHMDDFFLRPEQRTPERLSEAGGNIDRERFLEEVLLPLKRREPIEYRRFDCSTMKLAPTETVIPKRLTVIEGAYSMHPELAGYYDLSVLLDVSPDLQRKRIQKRNSPEMAQRFFDEWIPLERAYFSGLNVKARCDLILTID